MAFFDENCDDDNCGVSLFIPSLSPYTRAGQLKHFVILSRLGYVERVDMVMKTRKDGSMKQSAFVHFAKQGWNFRNRSSLDAYNHLVQGEAISIEYEVNGTRKSWTAMISNSKRLAEPPETARPFVKIQLSKSQQKKNKQKENDPEDEKEEQEEEEEDGAGEN